MSELKQALNNLKALKAACIQIGQGDECPGVNMDLPWCHPDCDGIVDIDPDDCWVRFFVEMAKEADDAKTTD